MSKIQWWERTIALSFISQR